MNRFFMVPLFRLGLGPILGSPYGGLHYGDQNSWPLHW